MITRDKRKSNHLQLASTTHMQNRARVWKNQFFLFHRHKLKNIYILYIQKEFLAFSLKIRESNLQRDIIRIIF